MGFRNGAYATIWEITPETNTRTKGRISVSRKNKQTEQYEQDFGGFVEFIGTAAAGKALKLRERSRIKLGDVDVQTYYKKETGVTYTNYKIFSFDILDENGNVVTDNAPAPSTNSFDVSVPEGDPEVEALPWM